MITWKVKVKKTHGDNNHAAIYTAAARLAKIKFDGGRWEARE